MTNYVMKKYLIRSNKILFGTPGKSKFIEGIIVVENGKIIDFVKKGKNFFGKEIIDMGNNYVLPGFIDNHTHGAAGIDVSGCTPKDLSDLSMFYVSKGVTGYLPTLTTNYKAKLLEYIKNISDFIYYQKEGAKVLGIHMEGPCISNKYRGAQNAEAITDPYIDDFKDYIEESRNNIKMVTIAPELNGAIEVIKYLARAGISLNIGHSNADFKTCIKSFNNGVNCISHFLNGMRPFHQHEPSIMGAALWDDEVYVELICDGFHLAPETVKIINKLIGPERIILITDSIMATGWADGKYDTPCFSEPLVVKNGDTQLLYSKSRAGSTLTLDNAFKNFIKFTGMPIEIASQCITRNPAIHLGLYSQMGSIEIDKDASFTIIDDDLNIVKTILNTSLH